MVCCGDSKFVLDHRNDVMNERATFKLLWDMVNAIRGNDDKTVGTIVSNYAGVIDDRIKDSGYSRSVKSLKLYTYDQLQDELDERDEKS